MDAPLGNKGLFATKPIADYQEEAAGKHLVRALGIPALIAFGIGGIIGTGIFVLTGLAAAQHAGPAIVISFIIAGIGCMFAGLCYSEFAAMVPVCGSAYAYSYATLGEIVAWFVGWNLVLEYMMACSTVAVGLEPLFRGVPGCVSRALAGRAHQRAVCRRRNRLRGPSHRRDHQSAGDADRRWRPRRSATRASRNRPSSTPSSWRSRSASCVAVIVFGAFYVNTANWLPYIPPNTGTFGQFGWSGIWQASAIIFFAYIGFDGVSTVAQEAKDPARGMPLGMLGSLGICTLLYILMSSVMTGLVPFKRTQRCGPGGRGTRSRIRSCCGCKIWVIIGALAGLTSVIITMIIPQARIWLTMSQRWPAAEVLRRGAPALSHPAHLHRHHRRAGRDLRRPAADRHSRRAGVDRHAGRLHRGMHRRGGAALHAARPAAAVQGAGRVVRSPAAACCSAA